MATWIKRSDQPLDVGALVNAISPWYFRTICFANYWMIPGETPYNYLGFASSLNKKFVHMNGNEKEDYVMVDAVWDKRGAIGLANEVLKRFAEPDTLAREKEEREREEVPW
jgi:hypothetical protein